MAITRSTTKSATGIEFVDLSDKPAKAKIVRQGFDVPEAKLDTKKVDQFLGDLTQISTKEAPRVVSQAIAPGTKVTAGTVVDLVMYKDPQSGQLVAQRRKFALGRHQLHDDRAVGLLLQQQAGED